MIYGFESSKEFLGCLTDMNVSYLSGPKIHVLEFSGLFHCSIIKVPAALLFDRATNYIVSKHFSFVNTFLKLFSTFFESRYPPYQKRKETCFPNLIPDKKEERKNVPIQVWQSQTCSAKRELSYTIKYQG